MRLSIILIAILLGSSAWAGEPRGWLDPLAYRDALLVPFVKARQLEITQMVSAVLNGSRMGPGDGWFHPSESRYDFRWLARRFDRNGDGRITREEMKDHPKLFERLDRDRDGVITTEDFNWSETSTYIRQMGMVQMWMSRIDSNSNGRISKQEWENFFEHASKGKDHLTPEDLREALMQMPRRQGPPPRGPSPDIMLAGLFNGELGSYFEGPNVGDRAPGFTLRTYDGKQTIRLVEYRGKKPVVLIFGSFT